METQKYLSQTIKAELAASNLTQTELAQFLHIDRRYLVRKLSNEKFFTMVDVDKIANFLGMSSWQLFALAEEREKRIERG